MTANLPKRGIIAETNTWGQAQLPPKAERVHGKPGKGDRTAMYLDRDGKVETIHFRMPEPKKTKAGSQDPDDAPALPASRPDLTRKGVEMIGDLRTDALHEALARAPIEDDMLMALLVLALAGRNVSIQSGASSDVYGYARMERHAIRLFDEGGDLAFDMDTLRAAARAALIDVLSARENRSDSGIVARMAGSAIGADTFLPNMGTEDFLSCLSRPALERACADTPVLPRQRVKDTRAALVGHFKDGHFVHPAALFSPDPAKLATWLARIGEAEADDEESASVSERDPAEAVEGAAVVDEAYRIAAE